MRNLFGCFGRRSSSSCVFCSRGLRETNNIERSRKARAKSLPLFREESCRCSRRRRRYHCHHHHRSCNKRRRRGRLRVLLRTWYHGTIFTTFSTQKFTCVCVLSRSRVHVHLYAFTVSFAERTGNPAFGACRPSRKPPPNRRGNKSGSSERTDAHHHHPPPPVLGTTTMMMRSLCATRHTRIKKSSSRKRL